jgi:hypothetical protein
MLDSNHVSLGQGGTATFLYLSSERVTDDSFGQAMDRSAVAIFVGNRSMRSELRKRETEEGPASGGERVQLLILQSWLAME